VADLFNNDAFQKLEKQMVENPDLSRAVESLKQDIEGEIGDDKTISQYNIERELESRGRTIESAVSNVLAKASTVKEDANELDKRTKEDDFKENLRRNAVDSEDMKKALNIIDQYQQLASRLTLVLKIYRDDRQLLRSGIDLQQQRANESEVMEMVKDLVNEQKEVIQSQQTEFRNLVNEMTDETVERLERVLDDKEDRSDERKELLEQMQETARELKEARETPQTQVIETSSEPDKENSRPDQEGTDDSAGQDVSTLDPEPDQSEDGEEHPDLTPSQEELYNLVEANPGKDLEWYADQLDQKENIVKMWRTKIQKVDGYEDFEIE
jgi:hypothetical protein